MGCTCEIRVKYDEGGYTNAACLNIDSAIDMLAEIWRQIGKNVVSVELALLDHEGEDQSVHLIYENGAFLLNHFPIALSSVVYHRVNEGESVDPLPKPKWRLVCERADLDPQYYLAYTDEECEIAVRCLNDSPKYVNVYPVPNE